MEMKEKKARVEDALNAARAVVEEGIVSGGGAAMLRAAKALDHLALADDEATGENIVRRVLEEADPADPGERRPRGVGGGGEGEGGDEGHSGVQRRIQRACRHDRGGIIDPAKVGRIALQNAASIALLLLTTEALIMHISEKGPAMPHGGGMGGDF
jgi:chaperonin GroEL